MKISPGWQRSIDLLQGDRDNPEIPDDMWHCMVYLQQHGFLVLHFL